MKKTKIVLLFSFFLTIGHTTDFDYYEFMNKEKKLEQNKGFFNFGSWNSENKEKAESKETYSQKKYGRTLKYKTYDEIKEDRLKKNTLLMLGYEYRDLKISEKIWEYNETTGQKTKVIDYKDTFEDEWTMGLYMSTLLDLKYFNIQQETRNTYLGISLGKYIDVDVQMDFTDGRTTDFYLMGGPFLRVNLKDENNLLSAGLQATAGYFITDSFGIFYTAKFNGKSFISEDNDFLIEKNGISKMVDQSIFLSIKF